MENELISVDSVLLQLTTVSWHLDRAGGRSEEQARLDIRVARSFYEDVVRQLPRVRGGLEQIQQLQARLAELGNRLRAVDGDGLVAGKNDA